MSSFHTRKGALRFHCALLLTVPLALANAARAVQLERGGPPPAAWPSWPWPVVAACLVLAPFFAEALLRRSQVRHAALDGVILLTGVGASSTVSALALILFLLAGGSLARVYVWDAVSLAGGLFWCIRYRRLLR